MHRNVLFALTAALLTACSADASDLQGASDAVRDTERAPTPEEQAKADLAGFALEVTDPVEEKLVKVAMAADEISAFNGRDWAASGLRVTEPRFEAGGRQFAIRYLQAGAASAADLRANETAMTLLRQAACKALGRAADHDRMPGGGITAATHEVIDLRVDGGKLVGTILPRGSKSDEVGSFTCGTPRG